MSGSRGRGTGQQQLCTRLANNCGSTPTAARAPSLCLPAVRKAKAKKTAVQFSWLHDRALAV